MYREWRISGDSAWMKSLWPWVRQSLRYGIATWDPDHTGTLIEPHHNTYDIEFWGADGTGYTFEYRIPWQTLNAKAPLKGGDIVASTVQFNYSRPSYPF